MPNLYDENYSFEFGHGNIYKQGEDVCIFASGTAVHTALDAASVLDRKGLSTMVVNMSSLSPFDEDLVVECARASRRREMTNFNISSLHDKAVSTSNTSSLQRTGPQIESSDRISPVFFPNLLHGGPIVTFLHGLRLLLFVHLVSDPALVRGHKRDGQTLRFDDDLKALFFYRLPV